VQVIHVFVRDKRVQRSVDGGGAWIVVEGAKRIEIHHLVFKLQPAISLLERLQLVHIERRQPVPLHRPEIAPAPLHPENLTLVAGNRVGLHHLCGRVTAGEVGQPEIAAEEIGSIAQQLGFVHSGRFGVDP
jgi:hypothetical protein